MNRKKSKVKHLIYLVIALAMLLYALPSISFAGGFSWAALFGAVWAGFALLVIGSHLHILIGVDEAKQKALDEIRREKLKQWQLKWPEEREARSMSAGE
ncbi:hypothetical protein JJQ72_00565 [Paenibacillus sp. F411]|uniref:Uncharacterized protein n=1 Tax=Paenibacillus algicola TaxID=2565926 RepID=A0A4P8XMB6_9BACL|nr:MULTISPECIES: hypothetical protein [Paenibacillus]MBO2942481.1 hypothetical protein [Paenibacillus sp. F411]QCT03583.1 hypothetical protein E6C60_2872 [Paenibacillus algicola]